MPPTQDLLTLTRQDLYELAWSKPLVELARDFGLSDVALAKRYRKLAIPIPGRGYWARVAAGQSPRRPALKQKEGHASALTFHAPTEPTDSTEHRPPGSAEEIALRERIVVLQPVMSPDHRPITAAAKRTAAVLKRPWRREITWTRGEKTGPVLRIETSDLVVDRALRLADQILLRANMVSWAFQAPPEPDASERPYRNPYAPPTDTPVYGCLLVQGEPLAFRIDERRRKIDHVLTNEEKERQRRGLYLHPPRWDFIPTGELRLHLLYSNRAFQTWKDSKKCPLEDQINTILLAFLAEALGIKAQREARRLAEIESRRKEDLLRRQSERRSANAKLIHELEAQAGAWLRARFLRSYLRALKRSVTNQQIEVMRDDHPIDFLSWAAHYIDQLDPLSKVPYDPDLMDEDLGRYGSDEGIRKTLSRLMGRHWQECWTLGDEAEPDEPDFHAATDLDE